MEPAKILTADLLDLVFDDRNKAYGAYELRRSYDQRIKKAMLITGTLIALIITGSVLARSGKSPQPEALIIIKDVDLRTIADPEPEPIKPPERQAVAQEQTRTEVFITPTITEDIVVTDPPVSQAVLAHVEPGLVPSDGPSDGPTLPANPPGDGKDIIDIPRDDEPTIHEHVQVEASYGDWKKFLLRNLRGDVPVENGAPTGRYTIKIKFVVDIDGAVSDIKPLTNLGYGMEEEAVRVMKKAERWTPAMQNGHYVKAYKVQLITFEVEGE